MKKKIAFISKKNLKNKEHWSGITYNMYQCLIKSDFKVNTIDNFNFFAQFIIINFKLISFNVSS